MSNGVLACPVASCPLQPLIYVSAFSQTTMSGVASTGSPYSATYPSDFYGYYGDMSVQYEHLAFPPASASYSSSIQNMNVSFPPSLSAALSCVAASIV